MTYNKIVKYIEENLPKCLRERTEDCIDEEIYGVPHPYTVPSVNHFEELYYWDTYFVNQIFKFNDQYLKMKNNTDNILYMIDRFGHMGNSNRTFHMRTSQPPFSSEMVKDVYWHFKDKAWLKNAFETLKKEYKFWMNERITDIALNQYGCTFEEKDIHILSEGFVERLGYRPDMSEYDMTRQYLICCESGWDLNYRWGMEAYQYVQVELNSILYGFEKNMERFSKELELGEEEVWSKRAETRKKLMNKYLLAGDGIFYDYSLRTGERGIFTDASIYPLFFGLANEEQAASLAEHIKRLETDFGITVCEDFEIKGTFQWAYPNVWPCIQYLAVMGFDKYGYKEIAQRIARKYIKLVENVFEDTGELWEKYNGVEGSHLAVGSYQTTMIGWTAGTYLKLNEYLNN